MATAKKTVAGTDKPEGTAAPLQPAESAGKEPPANKPLWSRTINRVTCSIWPQLQNGETRHSISLSRSYLDRRSNQWKRVHSYGEEDLKDLRVLLNEAEEKVLELKGLARVVGED